MAWVSSEWLKITRKYKYLKQTFRLLEEVVRETKARACPFSESGNAILSYEIEKHCVDVRDYTIRITNLEYRSVYFALCCYYFISFRTQRRWCCVFRRKNRNQIERSRHDAIVNTPWRHRWVSDFLANSSWLEFKNFKIGKEETKNGRENTDTNKKTIDLDWIDIWLIFLSRSGCDCLATP